MQDWINYRLNKFYYKDMLKSMDALGLIGNIDMKLMLARSTPERIVIGKRPSGVPLLELGKRKPSPAVAGEG